MAAMSPAELGPFLECLYKIGLAGKLPGCNLG